MSSTPSAIPLKSQVGGHAGVLTTEDGSLLIKPALPVELKFYQSVQSDTAFAPLLQFIPKFYGVLKLEGKVDENGPSDQGASLAAAEEQKDEYLISYPVLLPAYLFPIIQSLVLENLSHSFHKPNILDIKLGTVLHDRSASPEKVERMEKTARATTSFETGVRLTGFQVYDNITSEPVNTPKSYGKSIKSSDLPDGIARFFPVAPAASEAPSDPPASSSGLPAPTILPILEAMHEDIADLRDEFASVHMRMVGGSLLIIYEADWEMAEKKFTNFCLETAKGEDEIEGEEEDEEDENDDDDEANGSKKPGPPYIVKLIDFAHTHITPGQGPDEGVLLGFETVLRLLDGRIEQIRAEL